MKDSKTKNTATVTPVKSNIKTTLKLAFLAGLFSIMGLLPIESAHAGLITSNLTAATQVVYTGRIRVYQIVAYGATANMLQLTDSAQSTNQIYIPSYTRSTNYTITLTNLQTNATFVYNDPVTGLPTSTQYMRQTNIITGNARSNITVSAGVITLPVVSTIPVVAGAISTVPDLDLTFERGISITATNNATIILYTRDN